MGIFKLLGRSMIYPIVRPFEQAKTSFGQIQSDMNNLKSLRERKKEKAIEDKKEYLQLTQGDDWTGYKPTEAELKSPGLIKNPFLRFEVLYLLNGWDEQGLEVQLVAVRLARRVSAYMSIILMLGGLISLYFTPVWMMIFTAPLLVTGSAVGFASAVKHAIYQVQIQERKLCGFSELMSRNDFFKLLVSK